ncbi:MAG: beta-lactamase family protein, partial [Bacteroidia bacterium]|nr:beta-lactamase family protein [Bacteroidia bacterium]
MNKFVSFIAIFCLFYSCSNSTVSESDNNLITINQDSINKLAKEINAEEKSKLIDIVFKQRVKSGFNGAILVAQRNHVIYKNAAGFSNFQTKDTLSVNSQFQLASASKPFTATAILILRDKGLLSLSDTLQKHLPNFPYQGITIKDLLTHRSGLSNYVYFCEPYCDDKKCYNGKMFSNESVLDVMVNTNPGLYARPNKKFEYCNTN